MLSQSNDNMRNFKDMDYIKIKGKNRIFIAFMILLVGLVTLLCMNICIGSVEISVSEVIQILLRRVINETKYNIVWKIRFPRSLAAMFLGGALALSGYLLQTFFHNPIAGPFVLGISSGAKLVVAIVMILLTRYSIRITSFMLIASAFAGAMAAMGLVLIMSRRVTGMSRLVIGGIMVGYICSAITEFLITFASDDDIINLHNWSRGSFSGINWENISVIVIIVTITAIAVMLMAKPINAYQLGEGYAHNMGVNISLFRTLLVLLSSILSGCVTAFAGPVSFVGIAVPQIVKKMFNTSKPLVIIPASFVGGGVFCMFCDLLARTMFAPTELSISAVTAVFGAPVVIWVMIGKQKNN